MTTKTSFSLLLTALFLTGCQQKPASLVAKVTPVIDKTETKLAELHALAQDPAPTSTDWCTVLTWNKKLTDFMWRNQVELDKSGHGDQVTAEFSRRAVVRNKALFKTLQRSPVIPDCHFSDEVYDPLIWIMYAEEEGQGIPETLLISVAKEMIKKPPFKNIRNESWEARVLAFEEWRDLIEMLGIRKINLSKLGLTNEEIRQIYWSVESGK
jgi:hypothetical protein